MKDGDALAAYVGVNKLIESNELCMKKLDQGECSVYNNIVIVTAALLSPSLVNHLLFV